MMYYINKRIYSLFYQSLGSFINIINAEASPYLAHSNVSSGVARISLQEGSKFFPSSYIYIIKIVKMKSQMLEEFCFPFVFMLADVIV